MNADWSVTRTCSLLPEEYLQPRWYAAYTHARHEKRVAEQLEHRTVEHFLPLYETVRRWKDRRMRLQLPLFPGYVFVRLALHNRLQVLQVPSVVRLIGYGHVLGKRFAVLLQLLEHHLRRLLYILERFLPAVAPGCSGRLMRA